MVNTKMEFEVNQIALENSERFCVFRSGDGWFGISALNVRQILPRPRLTSIPFSDPILQGVGHIQNEFVPVISLQAITQIQYGMPTDAEQQLLVMLGSQGSWGILIDQAVSLASLETTISTFSNPRDRWSRVTIGSASFKNQVLQILDHAAMFQYVESLLEMYWQNADPADPKSNLI